MSSSTIIFFGNEQLCTGLRQPRIRLLPALVKHGYQVRGVFLPAERFNSRPTPLAIERFAAEQNLVVERPATTGDLVARLSAIKPQLGILAAYGAIIPPAVLAQFPLGILNLHPSLLPRHRGTSPIEQVILDGDTATGVSIMKLTPELDAGPLLAQATLPVPPAISKFELADQLLALGTELIITHLPQVLAKQATFTPQDERQASYSHRLHKSDGQLNLSQSATRLERQIRAYAGWPGSRLQYRSHDLLLLRAQLIDNPLTQSAAPGLYRQDRRLVLVPAEGALEIIALQPAGRREMSATDWLNAHAEVPELPAAN